MASAARRAASALVLLMSVVALTTSSLGAQGQRVSELTLSGFPLSVTGTTNAQFDALAVALGITTFTVDLTRNTGGPGFSPRVTTVNVQCATPCPASGTLPVGALQWRRSDLGAWNTLTTAFVFVESRTATFGGTNDPWSNSTEWRYQLSWSGTPPRAATQFNITFQLVVTAP